VASLVLLMNPDRDLLLPFFSVLILIGAVTVVANTLHPDLRQQASLRGFVAGICLSMVFFVLENLRTLGVLTLPWDVEWVGVLILYLTLGRLIALHMFTIERRLAAISQELATARRIQASLLPEQAPRVVGLSVAARYVPMTEVAGDIYDFVEVDDRRLGVLIADVSGHGVAAALIASLVKGAFRAQVDHIDRPERVLQGMNRILTGQLERKYVTVSCTFIDTDAGVLRYAGAGHPPLLIQQGDGGSCLELQQNGLILGQFPDAAYDSVERPLASGERLVICTDGILEAVGDGDEMYGEGSLRTFMAQQGGLPVDDFVDALLKSVAEWSGLERGEVLDDDLTVVVIDIRDRDNGPSGSCI
jgi:serine phosphatase RsbU (regulator of sigma subunit)